MIWWGRFLGWLELCLFRFGVVGDLVVLALCGVGCWVVYLLSDSVLWCRRYSLAGLTLVCV